MLAWQDEAPYRMVYAIHWPQPQQARERLPRKHRHIEVKACNRSYANRIVGQARIPNLTTGISP